MYKEKEVKATATKCLEGIIILITFFVNFAFKMIDIILKFVAFFTFDRVYSERRSSFHRQTIKSPKIGFKRGGKYYLKLFPEVISGFVDKPKFYHTKYGCPGVAIGIVVAILGIIKLAIGPFDWLWAILSGLLNMAAYEEDAMEIRSRPIRIFSDGTIKSYNYSEALAYEVMTQSGITILKN